MRSFNDIEKEIIDSLCQQDENSRVSETASRSLIYMIEEKIGVSKIRWNKAKTNLKVFGRVEQAQTVQSRLLDFVVLMKWLEENGYIYLFQNPNGIKTESPNTYIISTTTSKACFFIFSISFSMNVEPIESKPQKNEVKEHIKSTKGIQLPISLLDDITRIANSYVHVTQNLYELKKNGYRTAEQGNSDRSNEMAWRAIAVAIIIGFVSILFSVFGEIPRQIISFVYNLKSATDLKCLSIHN